MSQRLITHNLFEELLLKPALEGFNELCIVSGYASSSFLNQIRLGPVSKKNLVLSPQERALQRVSISVVYGMYNQGITRREHERFLALQSEYCTVSYFNPSGIHSPTECHSKLYIWLKNGSPGKSFITSANATTNGFFSDRREVASECNSNEAYLYFQEMFNLSQRCDDLRELKFLKSGSKRNPVVVRIKDTVELSDLPFVDLPLTTGGAELEVPTRSGLNWGQRDKRNKNQAYIPVPAKVRDQGFFPRRAVRFLLHTCDGELFECAIAQDGDKAIHSTDDNAELGRYFRRKLGLADGQFVEIGHLRNYGRTSCRIYRLKEDGYLLDFEKPPSS